VTAAEIRSDICMLLAGRAAEQVYFGTPSTGSGGSSGSDLASATAMAVAADTALGFGESLAWHGQPDVRDIPAFLAARPALAARVATTMAGAYRDAEIFVRANRVAIEQTADLLIGKLTVEGMEVEALVQLHRQISLPPHEPTETGAEDGRV
jgi:cell division protease FtsH